MELRKRVKPKHGLSQDAPSEGRCNHNALSGTQEGGEGGVSLLGRSGSRSHSGSGVSPLQPWQQCVFMAAGLLAAVLLALTQAWCVNGLHENLLWFSQLTVGVITCL